MGDSQADKHLEVKKLVIIGDGATGKACLLLIPSFSQEEIL